MIKTVKSPKQEYGRPVDFTPTEYSPHQLTSTINAVLKQITSNIAHYLHFIYKIICTCNDVWTILYPAVTMTTYLLDSHPDLFSKQIYITCNSCSSVEDNHTVNM